MQEKSELKRGLNLFDSVSIVAGSMIGSGIFIVSADMARILLSPGWLLIAWVLTGFITLTAALSYGELAGMFPHAGGMYVYLREAYGKLPAFLYGWTLFTVIQSGTIAAVAVAFAKFTGVIFPIVSQSNWIFKIGSLSGYNFGLNTENLLAVVSVIVLTLINTRGLESGKWVQNIFTVTKVVALLGLIFIGITLGRNYGAIKINLQNFWGDVSIIHQLPLLGTAMVGSLFSAIAWDTITYAAGEVKNPRKNIPLSLLIGTSVVTLLYFFANVAYLCILPFKQIQFAQNDRVGTAAMQIVFGEAGAIVMALLVMISTFGCNNGIIFSTARVYYAMAKDGLFFKKAGELNKFSVPAFALLIQCIWSCMLCVSGTYNNLLDYVIFAILLFYVLTILGLFILRITKPSVERPYKAFGYPFVPSLYILSALAIAIDLLIFKPLYSWPGLIIVLLGIPVYFLWRKK